MARKIRIDMTGQRFGRLVGIGYAHSQGSHAHWLFACDCGAETVADGTSVRAGTTASCGCLHREISAARLTKHGYRAKKYHGPTYRAWQEINTFCTNPRSARYRDFGSRGIAVCPAWSTDFEVFLSDMGERPRGQILVRRDFDGDFNPANCHWAPVRSRSQRACAGKERGDLGLASPSPVKSPDRPRREIHAGSMSNQQLGESRMQS